MTALDIAHLEARIHSFDEEIRRYKEAEGRLALAFIQTVKDRASLLFAAHPDLQAIRFSAYTPYWNDGDTCSYYPNIDIDSFFTAKEFEEIVTGVYGEGTALGSENNDHGFCKFIYDNSNFCLISFGDHKQITISRMDEGSIESKIEILDYDHD